MLTGKRFWTLAVVFGLCVLATAGCRRKSKRNTTVNTSGVFTTDTFPGATVQENNVADDKRAFSTSTDDYDGGLVCTHNGDRGNIMVTYDVDDQIFAHYYDGSVWTTGVALRHFDTYIGTTDAGEIVHAFVNTDGDDRSDAADRDGDCLIFWNATDFDSDGAGADDENQALYVSYFDVSHYTESDLNHGFDIDPSDPGFFWAQRLSSGEDSSEDVEFQGLVTDGLCGEARWEDGANVYSYGNATTAIFVFYHESEEKSVGVYDRVTSTCGFDLDFVIDEESPLLATAETEIAIQTFGADDTGATCQESCVGDEYASYNDVLFRRVRTEGASGTTSVPGYGTPGLDEDITLQYTHFNFGTFTLLTDSVLTIDPDSDGVDIDRTNSDFLRNNLGFLGCTGQGIYGRDEGLSCLVTWFNQVYDADNTAGSVIFGEDAEEHVAIAEISEETGAFLNDAEPSIIDLDDDILLAEDIEQNFLHTQISRNGDYIWFVYLKSNTVGTADDYDEWACQYLTTRVDGDGLPVAIPALTTTLGIPLFVSDDIEDGPSTGWYMFQDNLGYLCGQQSDAAEMNFFFHSADVGTGDSQIYWVVLTADVDGTVGTEAATSPVLLVQDDVNGLLDTQYGQYSSHGAFNATDAGQDGDFLYAFLQDDNESNGFNDVYVRSGRAGVTAAAPIFVGSGIFERHSAHPFWDDQELAFIATPPGTGMGYWNVDSAQYDDGAHHGAQFVHLVFREAETSSYLLSTPNTTTGWALRTRTYNTSLGGGTFGDDFTPNAGTAFRKPFDLDLPFVDPDTYDDAEILDVMICDNTVVLIFEEAGHIYYQECNPGDGGDDDQPGWLQEAAGVSNPALVDDDTTELVLYFEEICVRNCTCCTIDGAAIFWVKNLDDGASNDRLQVRVINGDSN